MKKMLKSLYISTKCSTLHDLYTTVEDKLSNLTAIKEKVTNLEENLDDITEQLTQQRRNALISNINNHQNTILRISFILKTLLIRMKNRNINILTTFHKSIENYWMTSKIESKIIFNFFTKTRIEAVGDALNELFTFTIGKIN